MATIDLMDRFGHLGEGGIRNNGTLDSEVMFQPVLRTMRTDFIQVKAGDSIVYKNMNGMSSSWNILSFYTGDAQGYYVSGIAGQTTPQSGVWTAQQDGYVRLFGSFPAGDNISVTMTDLAPDVEDYLAKYNAMNYRFLPNSIPKIVAHIQEYLSNHPIADSTTLQAVIDEAFKSYLDEIQETANTYIAEAVPPAAAAAVDAAASPALAEITAKADEAAESARQAGLSQQSAEMSEQNALTYRNQAQQIKDSITAEVAASVQAAQEQATLAQESAQAADESADTAEQHVAQARAQAEAAAAQAQTASGYASDAQGYMQDASDFADNAAQSAATFTTDTTLTISGKAADAKATGDQLSALKSQITALGDIVVVPYDYSSIATDKLNISSSKKWNSNNNYRAYYFQIPAGAKTLTVKGNETNGSSIALLAASDTHTHGDTPVYATGWSKTFVPIGTEQTYNIPSDAKYAWFLKKSYDKSYEPAFYGFNVDLSNVPKIPEIEETVEEMQVYLPRNVSLISTPGLSTGKYIDTDVGSNWTNGLTDNSGSLYTSAAIDVGDYYGDTLIIEIGSSDNHTGVRESGFCNASNIVSSVVREQNLPYQSEDGYLKARISITDKYFFFSCSSKAHLSISIDTAGTIIKECQIDTKFVATDGNDDNDGTYVFPFATINKALESGARCVAIKGGTYKQRIDLSRSKKSSLSIVNATVTGKVTLMSPDCVIAESETAVDGYTKVYSAETTKTFGDNNVWIFQDGVADESTLISSVKRMPEQRGQAYRCYDTKIKKTNATVLSDALTEIENSESYKWFKDGTTIYFSRPSSVSSDNPICGSFNTNLFSNGVREISLNVSGIDVKYMCFNVKYTSNSRIVDCSCMNVYGDGAFCFDGSDCLELIRCEAARAYSGSNGDGFNAHSSYDGYAFAHQTTAVLIDCWSHDNNDDGISLHEKSEFTVIGGLFEQNYYGGGITPANGSHCTCIGVYARDNGEGGFLYMNPTSISEGGVGGQIKCIDCVSESNNIWASATSAGYKINSAGNKGILVGCKAIGEDNGYYVSDNDGTLTLIDCGALNCTTVKGGKTANITVQNTTLVS